MEEFINTWGYWAVFLGSLVEGESVILTAGFLSAQGYLSLYKIILVAFIGTLIADQVLFHVGKYYGMKIIDRFPRLDKPAQRAFRLLHRHDTIFILSFRFIWGIRIISPLIIGAAGVSFKRFSPLNLIAAAVWSILSCSAGYLFGDFLMNHLGFWQRLTVLAALFLLFIIWFVWRGHRTLIPFFKKVIETFK